MRVSDSEPPENFKFVQIDILKDLPFKPASFDVIHARYLLIHVSNAISNWNT